MVILGANVLGSPYALLDLMSESAVLVRATEQKVKRILVVEDNVALRFTLATWLRSLDYIVFEAASADEAVVLLESSLVVDFVITDVQMPGKMDGFDLVHYIHQNLPGLNMIVVSANDHHHKLRETPVLFFRKPYDMDIMSSQIATLLDPLNIQNEHR